MCYYFKFAFPYLCSVGPACWCNVKFDSFKKCGAANQVLPSSFYLQEGILSSSSLSVIKMVSLASLFSLIYILPLVYQLHMNCPLFFFPSTTTL